eukprot:5901541-Alexandrium_andersonii.AAC.1
MESLEDMLESLLFDGDDDVDGAASASAKSVSVSSRWHAGHQAADQAADPPPPAPVETKRTVK